MCIEYGEDLTTFIELLRLVYDVRYVEQNSEDNGQRTKTLSRGSTKVFVNPKARKATNEAFFTIFLIDTNVEFEIFSLRRENDLSLLMQILRQNLMYGIFLKREEIRIVSAYLNWYKSHESDSEFLEFSTDLQEQVINNVITDAKLSSEYVSLVYIILSTYSEYISTVALLDLEFQSEPGGTAPENGESPESSTTQDDSNAVNNSTSQNQVSAVKTNNLHLENQKALSNCMNDATKENETVHKIPLTIPSSENQTFVTPANFLPSQNQTVVYLSQVCAISSEQLVTRPSHSQASVHFLQDPSVPSAVLPEEMLPNSEQLRNDPILGANLTKFSHV